MSDHVPSYARHDAGRSPPPRARPPPRGSRREDDRGHDRSGDRFGDRSSGHDDRRDRDRRLGGSPLDAPARRGDDREWEYGVVVTLRDAFGFVKGFKRGSGPQLFFHASEVRGGGIASLRAGDEVKFVARDPAPGSRPGDRDGKANALDVTALTAEDREPNVVARDVRGTVKRALRGRTKLDAYGGRVAVARETETTEPTKETDDDDDENDGDEGTTTLLTPSFASEEIFLYEFSGKDLAESCPRLREGDVVSFDLVEHKFTGERRLADVTFVRHAERKPAGAATKDGGVTGPGSGAEPADAPAAGEPSVCAIDGREAGRVEKLTPSYGFIRKIGGRLDDPTRTRGPPNPSLFFHYTQLAGVTRERDLNLGCAVTFLRGEDGRSGKPTAVDVSLAPEEEARKIEAREKAFLREQARAAAAPATGSDADRWGKEKTSEDSVRDATSEDDLDLLSDPSLELGVVSVMKANYGFIKCCARRDDVFFHFTEVRGGEAAVSVGQDVAFKVEHRQAPGQRRGEDKPVAVAIRAAPKGSAVFETVEETFRSGVCVERLVFGRAGGYGARSGEQGGAPGALECALRDSDDEATFVSGIAPFSVSEGVPVTPERALPPKKVSANDDGKDGSNEGGVSEDAKAKKETATRGRVRLTFSRAGLADAKTNPRPGDVVRFKVRTDTRTKRKTATAVEPVRFSGVVVAVKQQGSYGFFEHDDPEAVAASAGDAHEAASDAGDAEDADDDDDNARASDTADANPDPTDEPEKTDPVSSEKAKDPKDKDPSELPAKGKGEKWQYESEIAAAAAKAAAKKKRNARRAAAGKMRVFFHGSDVEGGATLREGDEVEYCVTLPVQLRGRRGDGPGGGGKDPQARRIVRTKEAPAPMRPTFVNAKASDFGAEPTGDRPASTQFTQGRVFAQASMPDGTRGFSMGRGKGLAEAARAAISKLKLDAAPFAAPGSGAGSGAGSRAASPAPEVRVSAEATEDA